MEKTIEINQFRKLDSPPTFKHGNNKETISLSQIEEKELISIPDETESKKVNKIKQISKK